MAFMKISKAKVYRLTFSLIILLILGLWLSYSVVARFYGFPQFMVDLISEEYVGEIPAKNLRVLELIQQNGRSYAPDYKNHVCTQFVASVLSDVMILNKTDRKRINVVIGNLPLDSLVSNHSDLTRGVVYAMEAQNACITINKLEDAAPGDFIQYWNKLAGGYHGHSAIISSVNPTTNTITIHSSHPKTNGYGKQVVFYPEIYYVGRLK